MTSPVVLQGVSDTIDAIATEAFELAKGSDITRPEKRTKTERLAQLLVSLSGAVRVALELPTPTSLLPKPVLTEADAEADLNGTPRPDNPSPEATAEQTAEQ